MSILWGAGHPVLQPLPDVPRLSTVREAPPARRPRSHSRWPRLCTHTCVRVWQCRGRGRERLLPPCTHSPLPGHFAGRVTWSAAAHACARVRASRGVCVGGTRPGGSTPHSPLCVRVHTGGGDGAHARDVPRHEPPRPRHGGVCAHTHTNIHICVPRDSSVCVHPPTHTHTNAHTHSHTHAHTHHHGPIALHLCRNPTYGIPAALLPRRTPPLPRPLP